MSYTTIDKPTDYFNTVLYTGNATSRSITGVGFQPDFVWNKTRSAGQNHFLYDSVRGAQKDIRSNQTGAEGTSDAVTAFNSDGFSVGSGNDGNENSQTYVNWNWKETATAGFDIVSYTGNGSHPRTISHSLSAVPQMIIIKDRDQGTDWFVYHQGIDNTHCLLLNATNAKISTDVWNDTTPTSSVFSLGTGDVNTNNIKYIAYCFAEKKGYSKFGSYTGNGNADGTFIYTGFKPAFVIIKQSSASGNQWNIYDNKRNTFNVMDKFLLANSDQAEASYSVIDFVSNGIKLRNTASNFNTSGSTYIYMCFAESPFVTSAGIPTTAR